MRTISFILAFAFVLAGPSMAGSSDNSLPGIGTFSYNGSPVRSRRPADRRRCQLSAADDVPRKLPVKALYVRSYLFRRDLGFVSSRRLGASPGQQAASSGPVSAAIAASVRCSRCPIRAANSCGCARPIWSGAGRIRKPFAAACTTTPPPPSKIPTCAKPCCAASARPACRRSRPIGCRRRSNPRSARPSPRSPSRRCNACSSRRTN